MPTFEECFASDVRERLRNELTSQVQFHRSIEIAELDLPDYERPLKKISRKRKSYTFIDLLKIILP